MVEYVHYGHKEFLKELFKPIKNIKMFSKPIGGFWASRVNALYGWKDFSKDNDFGDCREDNCFKFSLSVNAKIFTINSMIDFKSLPKAKQPLPIEDTLCRGYIDFERLFFDGVDAIEVNISSDSRLYMAMHGWDCDSILIMNSDIICVHDVSAATRP